MFSLRRSEPSDSLTVLFFRMLIAFAKAHVFFPGRFALVGALVQAAGWPCPQCTLVNVPTAGRCMACHAPNPAGPPRPPPPPPVQPTPPAPGAPEWVPAEDSTLHATLPILREGFSRQGLPLKTRWLVKRPSFRHSGRPLHAGRLQCGVRRPPAEVRCCRSGHSGRGEGLGLG